MPTPLIRNTVVLQPRKKGRFALDNIPGSVAAYSLRRLRTAYTGSAIRVRRSSDNAEQDIGFDSGGNLDTSALSTLVGEENLLLNSENFGSWNLYLSTVQGDQIQNPFNTGVTADKITSGNSSDGTVAQQFYNKESGTTYTFSCYVKAGNVNRVMMSQKVNTSVYKDLIFDLSSKTFILTPNDATYGYTELSDGWFRLYLTATAQGSGSYQNTIGPLNNNATAYNNTTNGNYIYAWGGQLNKNGIKTYAKTTSAALDGAASAYIVKWYDQSGNTNDAAQTTADNQPRIVNVGIIDVEGIYFNTKALKKTSFSLSQPYTANVVVKFLNETNYAYKSFTRATSNFDMLTGSQKISLFSGNTIDIGNLSINKFIITFMPNGASGKAYNNGTLYSGNFGSSNLSSTTLSIGGDSLAINNSGEHNLKEVIFFNVQLIDSNRTKLEQSQSAYYNITIS